MSELADSPYDWPVVSSDRVFDGPIFGVRRDVLRDFDGGTFKRDVVTHKGAVVVAAVDDAERILVVTQYRHAARERLVELPAGLLDKDGEDPLVAAQRELAEEGHIKAERWSPLLRLMSSAGMTDELVTVFLAEEISETPEPDGFTAVHEERTMTREWVRLDDLVDAVLAGRVKNSSLSAAVLAVQVRRLAGRPTPAIEGGR